MQDDAFAKARYLSLTTFRRDGRAVATAVWFVPDGDRLLVLTGATSGKVKRLRNDARVLVAPSDMRGRPNAGAVEATARLQDAAGTEAHARGDQAALRPPGPRLLPRWRRRRSRARLVGIEIDLVGRSGD